MGFTLLAIILLIYYFRSSLRSAREEDSTRLGQQRVSDHGAREHNETKLDPAPPDADQGTQTTSNASSKGGAEEQPETTASATAEPEKAQQGQTFMNAGGSLNNSHDFVLYQSVMNNIHEAEEKVLRWLAKFTMSCAEFDARGHVPGCHPGTRITILETLQHWIDDLQHTRRMLWLRGPAGVGKSAILQSLAEQLSETSKLGATLFFSRPDGRNNPDFVIPTIVYQLAVRIPPYKEYIKRIMINDPKLLEKDMERQFESFIVEPFTKLKLMEDGRRWAILLDGLDECDGENAQTLIIKLVSRFTCKHPTTPLIWVIASRPEAHLQVAFSSEDVSGSFEEHEVLANSGEGCRDVEKFLRAKFGEIHQNYRDLVPVGVPWPAERDITRVSKTSSGLFALATTIVNYVGDKDACDPISQLATVLSVTEGLEPGSLLTLHTLYSAILASVPKTMTSTLKMVLESYTRWGRSRRAVDDDTDDPFPLVVFATISGLQQHTVYGALRKLHSVIKVPLLNESGRRGIRFYHASFPDYLLTRGFGDFNAGMKAKLWCGCIAFLCGGNSSAYQAAISDGRPPVPLSWDVELPHNVLKFVWGSLLGVILLRVQPCLFHHFDHLHQIPNTNKLQNILENVDFSTLIFHESHRFIFWGLFSLFMRSRTHGIPPELSQSDLVKKTPMRDLDFTQIPEAKLSHEFLYVRGKGVSGTSSDPSRHVYTSPQHLHRDWDGPLLPFEELVVKLEKLRSENPMVDVLVIGRGPSRQCALICTQPPDVNEGKFLLYYVPYCL